jgi:hypothetical protein
MEKIGLRLKIEDILTEEGVNVFPEDSYIDKIVELVFKELDKAREEGREEGKEQYKRNRAEKLANDIVMIQKKEEPYRDEENIHMEIDDLLAKEIGGEVLNLYNKDHRWGWYS